MSVPLPLRGLLLALLLALSPPALAQRQASEPEIKAAILVNMLLFVEWPESGEEAEEALAVCYLSDSPVADALVRLDGKILRKRRLRVLRTDETGAVRCHALYVSQGDDAALLASPPGPGPLLAGDTPGDLQRGVMVNLELVAGRVVFDVDLRAARRAGLNVSSKALRLARTVLE
ncbi:YfiR family protein [Aromatoleum anaerobium]|uniref:DUF4154 domain-containing protein n=1 Tax=Aromatoleum anaerobium TaxID=182180 RepID=A0ABX1PR84_9RHOO|nr:YfiR family protein [Aromatoleum anaerobium]MCK0508673.1 YfiR family protein [Aromatoleum anaerobium]